MSHSPLPPSSAARWIACPPSAHLEAKYPETTSSAADEGTLAHAFGEAILKQHVNPESLKGYSAKLKALKAGNIEGYRDGYFKQYYSEALVNYAQGYASTVLSALPDDGILFVEKRVRMDSYVPQGYGTMDAGILIPSERRFIFYDLKYGKGVQVFAHRNKQLMDYAVGVLQEFGFMADIDVFELNIHQPRLDHFDPYVITRADLLDWADNELKPAALLASKGLGELTAGDHCKFCKAKAKCKAFTKMADELEQDFEFLSPHLLRDREILGMLPKIKLLEDWMESVKEYMYAQALGGKKWDGFKLVYGASRRVITDEVKAAELLKSRGYMHDEIYRPLALVTLGDLEALVGQRKLPEILGSILHKPQGAITLVPESAKGEEISAASKLFAEVIKKERENNSTLDFLN